jgi:hypothetical protein
MLTPTVGSQSHQEDHAGRQGDLGDSSRCLGSDSCPVDSRQVPSPRVVSPHSSTARVGSKGALAFEEANLKLKREVYREAAGPASVSSVTNTGSYTMGGKWIAQLIVPAMRPEQRNKRSRATANETPESSPRDLKRVFLGRFDSEEDALSVVKMAKQEWAATGSFSPRRMMPSPRPGTYISSSMPAGGQYYGHSYMTGRAGSTNQPSSQYLPSGGGGQQMKPMYAGDHRASVTQGMAMGAAAGGSRTQSVPSSVPSPSSQAGGHYQYPSFLPSRGAMPQTPQPSPSSMGSYLSAPRTHLPSYPLPRPGEVPSSHFPQQGLPPYASQNFQRNNTSSGDANGYPTPPEGQVRSTLSFSPPHPPQVMFLTSAPPPPRGHHTGPTGLPQQLPSLPRQMP